MWIRYFLTLVARSFLSGILGLCSLSSQKLFLFFFLLFLYHLNFLLYHQKFKSLVCNSKNITTVKTIPAFFITKVLGNMLWKC